MLKFGLALVVITATRTALAGPFCGRIAEFAPAPETNAAASSVPPGATVAMFTEDFYYNGKLRAYAKPSRVRAKIDGASVPIAVRDVRARDGVIRYITIRSREVGKLELFTNNLWTKEIELAATYTISSSWQTSTAATATVERSQDSRLGPYRWIGQLAAVRVDAPAIGFTLKWRRAAKGAWRTLALPASIEPWPSTRKRSEARLGQTMCGMVENVPLGALEAGIEAELVATLPDGRSLAVDVKQIAIPPPPKQP